MLDSSWARYKEFHPVFARARAARASIVTAVYDLLPMVLPAGNIVAGGKEWFESWVRDAVGQSDALVCISRTVADDVIDYMESGGLARPGQCVGYWHLGANFADFVDVADATPRVREAIASPYLLIVGTIEPRKCHALAVDAMERLWARGETLRLVITGKEGWMVEDLMARLRAHPQLGRQLFLVEQPTDAEVATLYDRAAGLLFLSRGEGFGLPLVEAASHGIPIVCSDLPVFHEVAGEYATYVSGCDGETLAAELDAWCTRRRANAVPDTRLMPKLSWAESAEALLRVVADGDWHWTAENPS
jgi:glycosyltransferase involved in cell wall biosynthesis